jgi:hypothetical protein
MKKLTLILVLFFSTSVLAEGLKYLCEETHRVLIQQKTDGSVIHGRADIFKFIFEKTFEDNYKIDGSYFNNYIDTNFSCEIIVQNFVCTNSTKTTFLLISNNYKNFGYSEVVPRYSDSPKFSSGTISSIGTCNKL